MTTPAEDNLADAIFCPECGYDLRATTADVCNECGASFDRAALRVSNIPWVHRRKLGRFRAYLQTVRLVTSGSPKLLAEIGKPQNAIDARRFRNITAVIVAIVLLAPFSIVTYIDKGLGFLAVSPTRSGVPFQWLFNFAVPWSAGATIWGVIPIGLVLIAFHIVGAPRYFVHRHVPDHLRQRAAVLALYTTAPLTLWLLALLITLSIVIIENRLAHGRHFQIYMTILYGLVVAFEFGAPLLTLIRVGQWSARFARRDSLHGLFVAVRVTMYWIVGCTVVYCVIPFCIGSLWIFVDSLR